MNCGNSATKKTASLGLASDVTRPSRNARPYAARRALRTTIAVAGPGVIVISAAIGRKVQSTAAAYPPCPWT